MLISGLKIKIPYYIDNFFHFKLCIGQLIIILELKAHNRFS